MQNLNAHKHFLGYSNQTLEYDRWEEMLQKNLVFLFWVKAISI
jgi:hypothetical protein